MVFFTFRKGAFVLYVYAEDHLSDVWPFAQVQVLADALDEIRRAWDGDPHMLYTVRDAEGVVKATCIPQEGQPRVCITTFADGTQQVHLCGSVRAVELPMLPPREWTLDEIMAREG